MQNWSWDGAQCEGREGGLCLTSPHRQRGHCTEPARCSQRPPWCPRRISLGSGFPHHLQDTNPAQWRALNPPGPPEKPEPRAALRIEFSSLSPCCFLGYAEHFSLRFSRDQSPNDDPKTSSQARTGSSKLSQAATCCHQGDVPEPSWGTFLLEDALQTEIVTLSSQLQAAGPR